MRHIFSEVQNFLGPNILGTLVTAAFGAFAGAWVASRRETKRSVVAELNSINAARALCFSISNKFLGLKGQHILNLHRDYSIDREVVLATLAAANAGAQVNQLQVRCDLQTFPPVWLPIGTLERLIFEKISIRGRALIAAIDLVAAIDFLEKSIGYRNELILEIQRQSPPLSQRQLIDRYFGLPSPQDSIDERFSTNIAALYAQTDDCIFFSQILAEDLFSYGTALRKRYAKRFRLGVRKLVREDWTIAESRGLLPSRQKYAKWLGGFRTHPTRFERIKRWCGLGGNPVAISTRTP